MRIPSFRRAATLTLVAACMAGTTACFGSFNMTRKVYAFNKSVSDDKFVQELVFLGLGVVQIYSIASFIDLFVANSVEFWTGENPITASSLKIDASTRMERFVMEKDGVRVMTLKTFKLDQLVATTLVKHETGARHVTFETVYPNGRTDVHATELLADGSVSLVTGASAEKLLSHK